MATIGVVHGIARQRSFCAASVVGRSRASDTVA